MRKSTNEIPREREVQGKRSPPGSLSFVEEAAGAEEVDDDVLDDE